MSSSESTRDSAADGASDWRSHRATPRFTEPELPPPRRKGSGFTTPRHEGELSPADTEERWTSKFKPSGPSPDSTPGSRFGSMRGRGDMGPPQSVPSDEGDWRRSTRNSTSREHLLVRSSTEQELNDLSASGSVPSTPQMGRRKLELLPRSSNASAQPTPLSSPKSSSHQTTAKPNPFGIAK